MLLFNNTKLHKFLGIEIVYKTFIRTVHQYDKRIKVLKSILLGIYTL